MTKWAWRPNYPAPGTPLLVPQRIANTSTSKSDRGGRSRVVLPYDSLLRAKANVLSHHPVSPCPRVTLCHLCFRQAKIDTSEQSRSRPTGGGSDVEAPYSCTESPTAPSCTAKIVSQQTENLCDTTSTMTLLAWTLLHYRPRHSASERKVNEKERDQNEECMRR